MAQIMDFIRIDINHPDGYELRIGIPYLVQSSRGAPYYLKFIFPFTTDLQLLPYIRTGQIFLFT